MTMRFRLPFEASRTSGFTTPLRLLLATTAAFWMGTAQPQVNTARAARPLTELRFRDFFASPVGPTGLAISDTLQQVDGQAVRLVGYMVQQDKAAPGRFMLAPRPVQLSEHADGEADDLPATTVMVYLDPSQQDWVVPHVRGLVAVSGTMRVSRHEQADGRVSWVRLQLDPQATRGMNPDEVAGYLHQRQHKH